MGKPNMKQGPFRAVMLAAALVLAGTPVLASDWTVLSMSGPVKFSKAGQWFHADNMTAISHGAWLKTGVKGYLTLERDGIKVVVRPQTLVALASLANAPEMTAIVQRWGGTTLDVEPRGEPRVKVHTPFLAAVVKGTRFDVDVDRCYSRMHVEEGEITVQDAPRGLATDITSGQGAGSGRSPRNHLSVDGPGERAPFRRIQATSGIVPGLARDELVTPQNVEEPAMRLPRRPEPLG